MKSSSAVIVKDHLVKKSMKQTECRVKGNVPSGSSYVYFVSQVQCWVVRVAIEYAQEEEITEDYATNESFILKNSII